MAGWHDAQVDERKILDYLLSVDHPIGADKGAFFASVGYRRQEWTRLRDDLLQISREGELVAEQPTRFGIKYVVDGMVQSPDARSVELRTIWISEGPEGSPRLVTAYPR